MAIGLAPIFKKAYYSLVFLGGAYLLFVLALTFPAVQRNALYVHNVNPTFWQELSNVQSFGFLPHQVQPFTLRTADNETLYAWHILPLHLAEEHFAELATAQEDDLNQVKTSDEVVDTVAFKLLASDSNAHVMINFHGNAAHLASAHRPMTYQRLLGLSSASRPIHVIAFDYRGFGLSTGTPTEEGLITDGETVLSFLTGLATTSAAHPAPSQAATSSPKIPANHLILTSQSLGTSISTATLHRWTLTYSHPPPKGLILMSAFSSLPSLIESYSIKGVMPPLFSPFRSYKPIMDKITAYMADQWPTTQRLGEILASAASSSSSSEGKNEVTAKDPDRKLHIEILHAKDDTEIPWWEAKRLWDQAIAAAAAAAAPAPVDVTTNDSKSRQASDGDSDIDTDNHMRQCSAMGSCVQIWHSHQHHRRHDSSDAANSGANQITARFTLTPHGGHDRLAFSEAAAAAAWRVLEA